MSQINILIIFVLTLFNVVYPADSNLSNQENSSNNFNNNSLNLGSGPSDPSYDRARGYLTKGKFKTAIINYGTFIDWDHNPSGLWGDYQYFPALGFLFGVPGAHYSHKIVDNPYSDELGDWYVFATEYAGSTPYNIYKSHDAYDLWVDGSTVNFSGVVFDMGLQSESAVFQPLAENCNDGSVLELFDDLNQWIICQDAQALFISLNEEENPNIVDPVDFSSRIGFIHPWAKRPKFKKRESSAPYRDEYFYGEGDPWTSEDYDDYAYYGANVAESWFKGESFTDWQPVWGARGTTHGTKLTSGDIFGGVYTDPDDTYPMLATSTIQETWPENPITGQPEWPGWYAEITQEGSGVGVDGVEATATVGTFISDEDVYMEFDDRWAHRGNAVELGEDFENIGYPMGITVKAMAHSYGVAFAEDVAFFTVKVRNESGEYYDEDGNYHEAMVMPDGSTINNGAGFDYKDASMGFYFDVDSYSANADGSYGGRSNDDDMMGYDENFDFAYIYDKDDDSYGATNLAWTAVKLLDTPLSSGYVDIDGDAIADINPGDTLGMTDWHHFSWYERPGVLNSESGNVSCYGGSEGCPISKTKEEIQFKIMSGDTLNLTTDEKAWYFHASDMDAEEHPVDNPVNPHFDSMDGLLTKYPDGLDCVLMMSCGPFDLKVGEEVFFSFAVIMGQNLDDLRNNATMAQLMYDESYQGFSPPATPEVYAIAEHEKVTLYWDDVAEDSRDRITNYSDFEGYRIYKSKDGGETWGDDAYDMIFDSDGIHVGWRPLAQFDLSSEQDEEKFGIEISGADPLAPWFDLGSNTGIIHSFVDTEVNDGVEYTYSVTAYDMGVDADYEVIWSYQTDTVLVDSVILSEIDSLIIDSVACNYSFFGQSFTDWYTTSLGNLDNIGSICNGTPNGTCDDCDTLIQYNEHIIEYDITNDTIQMGFYAADTVYNDGTWQNGVLYPNTNPDHWASPHGLMSLETSKGTSYRDKNYVEVTPGFKATNVEYPNVELDEDPFLPIDNPYPIGTGKRDYIIVNEESHSYELDGGLNNHTYLYTINAEHDPSSYQNLHLINPSLYVYEVVDSGNGEYVADDLHQKSLNLYEMIGDSLILDEAGNAIFADHSFILDQPETKHIVTSDSAIIIEQPRYMVSNHHIESLSDLYYRENWSEFHNGLMVRYTNPFSNINDNNNKIDTVSYDLTGDPTCVGMDLINFDLGLEYFYDYEIRFGEYSQAYKNPTTGWTSFDTDGNGLTNDNTNVATCINNLIAEEWEYPFSIININTNEKVMLVNVAGLDEYELGKPISFFEVNVTDSTYYKHYDNECDQYVFKTYNFGLDLIKIPISSPWCQYPENPFYNCCVPGDGTIPIPWSDGDSIKIETGKRFIDGDSWVLDMEVFAKSRKVTKSDLEKIKVVPNPYIVRSEMGETKFTKQMAFTKLPEKCTIKIYTITGELIRTLNHYDSFDSWEYWDLRTSNNQEIAPGLYVYTVEAQGVKHISKFAVVR